MIELEKFNKIYEGKAKILYETSDPNYLIQYFKDDITAGNGEKKDILAKKVFTINQYAQRYMNILPSVR